MYVDVRKYYITRIEEIYEIRLDRKEALQFQKKSCQGSKIESFYFKQIK